MTTTAEVVHTRECATRTISDADRERGVWVACNCGAEEASRAAAGAPILEDRAGVYLYAAWMAYRTAGNDEKRDQMSRALEAIGKAPE